MSAFMCGDYHFQRIADSLYYYIVMAPGMSDIEHLYTWHYTDGNRLDREQYRDHVAHLVGTWKKLNQYSLSERYGEDYDEHAPIEMFTPDLRKPPLEWKDLVGALDCLVYQSCEGDAEKTRQYQRLNEFRYKLGHHAFRQEHEDVLWEIREDNDPQAGQVSLMGMIVEGN